MRALINSYDVVVIGAGPAGSMASYNASKMGAKTLLVEKSQEIGEPVRCAEAVPKIDEIYGIPADPSFVRTKLDGGYIVAPNGKTIAVKGGKTDGYVVERKIFDKYLAIRSAKQGTKIAVKSRVVNIEQDGSGYLVSINHMGEEYKIKTKIVIAADGVESSMAEMVGLKSKKNVNEVCSCAEYEMTNGKCIDDNMLELYFGSVAPKGYAWIFPKGDTVNVGLGVIGAKKSALEYLDDFISNPVINGRLDNATPVEFKCGGAPVGGPIEKTFKEGFMIVGDAAGQISPLTGGGIALSMDCGLIAGEVAGKCIMHNDCSEEAISEYETNWHEKYLHLLKNDLKYKNILQQLTDKELDAIGDSIDGDLEDVDVPKIALKAVKKSPSLLKYLKELL
ncbi:geranylgeranyl reductase family protein [Methanococcus voltae]|uniref:Digeranylgeranylglycerophospholipid reductase n=1 Tax=Methanococcus voltae (strain ATCC BAA-1334 / A3) TaxID=456320 RepID=D7DR67_METV3|nr:NAD(P)/FAD-dependent oxidoreductase [Methanococcus voltae]MCS3901004.1 digeranylgeranylglycerophospholipid reductase [Methanococcus voltae]